MEEKHYAIYAPTKQPMMKKRMDFYEQGILDKIPSYDMKIIMCRLGGHGSERPENEVRLVGLCSSHKFGQSFFQHHNMKSSHVSHMELFVTR